MNTALFAPISINKFPFLEEKDTKDKFFSFIFDLGEDNFNAFLADDQIDPKCKFEALVTKYAIVSNLPEEFGKERDEEMDLLYKHIEQVTKDYAEYMEINEPIRNGNYVLSDTLSTISDNIFSKENKTNYDKNVKFITDIYRNLPILTKDRIINFQGQPSFNKLIRNFLIINPQKNEDIFNLYKECISNDPSCIYKFSTTSDAMNNNYKQVENSGDFSGNFICNFPNLLDENGKLVYQEGRCQYNILSEILYTLNYEELSGEIKDDIKREMLDPTLESLFNHIKLLKENNNTEELQKINYLLNCPIKDPNTEKIVTPMDLMNNLVEKGVINLTKEQKEQFNTEPIHLQTINEVKNSIEFKKAVAKKQKEEKMKEKSIPLNEHRTMEEIFTPEILEREAVDRAEIEKYNNEIKKLQEKLEEEKEKTKSTRRYKVYNFFSNIFLGRETKYKTKSEILMEKELSNKIIELSKPFFNLATDVTKQQMLDENKSKQVEIQKEHNRNNDIKYNTIM